MTYVVYGNKNKLFREHQKTLEIISKKYEEHTRLKTMSNQIKWDMDEIASISRSGVINSKTVDGKPMHKNAEERNTALGGILRAHAEYNRLREMRDTTEDQLIGVDNDIKMLRLKLHFYEVNA